MAPTRAEVDALLKMAGKSPVAVRAVAKLCDDFKAPVMVTSRQIDEFESDIATLEDLAKGPLTSSPMAFHSELCAVMNGQPKPIRRGDGYANAGHQWDSLGLLIQRSALAGKMEHLKEASDAWGADITYSVAERVDKAQIEKERQAAEYSHEEYTPRPEPTSSTEVVDRHDGAVELAAEIGRQTADRRNTAEKLAPYIK